MRLGKRAVFSAAVLVVLWAVFAFPNGALAGADCQRVYGTGLTFQSYPFGPFEGEAELNLGDAQVVTWLLGPPDEKPDGTLHALTQHNFLFDSLEDILTIDKGILAPTDTFLLYNLNTRAKICATDCEGEIASGQAPCGRLSIHGTIDFGSLPPVADWRVRGKICDCSAD